jgi:hypothetical protein
MEWSPSIAATVPAAPPTPQISVALASFRLDAQINPLGVGASTRASCSLLLAGACTAVFGLVVEADTGVAVLLHRERSRRVRTLQLVVAARNAQNAIVPRHTTETTSTIGLGCPSKIALSSSQVFIMRMLTVAVAQLNQWALDFDGNMHRIEQCECATSGCRREEIRERERECV